MRPLAAVVEPGADFFIEDLALTAIVFDAGEDDVTVWATTVFDDQIHFFHLALTFADLSTLLRLADERGPALDEEVADALAAHRDPPPRADDANDDAEAAEVLPTVLEFITEERPPVVLPAVAMKLAFTYVDEAEDADFAFNIFSLEGIYVRLQ